jgi:hypothetical protein
MSPPLTTSSTPLRGAFTVLSEYPRMGRSRDDLRPGLRSFAVGQYVIVYAIEEENVLILHVFQSPGHRRAAWLLEEGLICCGPGAAKGCPRTRESYQAAQLREAGPARLLPAHTQ